MRLCHRRLNMIHPEPLGSSPVLLPFFLPYAGCVQRCIFCAQDKQTGMAVSEESRMELELERLKVFLREEQSRQRRTGSRSKFEAGAEPGSVLEPDKIELAFFGGTFTALPKDIQLKFLDIASEFRMDKAGGFLSAVRCSTRPDALTGALTGALVPDKFAPDGFAPGAPGINPLAPDEFAHTPKLSSSEAAGEPLVEDLDIAWLLRLKNAGLDLIELGIQSFMDSVLESSGRGYSGTLAVQACRMVKAAGLRLGVQLLPGLPGQTPGMFINDMEVVREMTPECLRLYPCQVVEGSALAALWRRGAYTPWQLELTVELLSQALLMAWGRNIRVIRMGLAPEPDLDSAVLAGPRHPALGQMARSKALWRFINFHLLRYSSITGRAADRLYAPERYQGEIFGYANKLLPRFLKNGLEKKDVIFWKAGHFMLS